MRYLLDTNILLRLLNSADPLHREVTTAVSLLHRQEHTLYITVQNVAEFWNVCTRPSSSRGGLGLTIAEADSRLRLIEFMFPRVYDSPTSYNHLRQLLVACNVHGVQVHDARLVALTLANGIAHILTTNVADFARYSGITPVSPASIVSSIP
jgi:predicted nucleic acid-binding protein